MMTWYLVNTVETVEYKQETNDYYPVYENFILVAANSESDAKLLAADYVEKNYTDDLSLDGKAARQIFQGVRKITSLPNFSELKTSEPSGLYLTSSFFEFKNLDSLHKFINGDDSEITYIK